jgi:hypothetical protein
MVCFFTIWFQIFFSGSIMQNGLEGKGIACSVEIHFVKSQSIVYQFLPYGAPRLRMTKTDTERHSKFRKAPSKNRFKGFSKDSRPETIYCLNLSISNSKRKFRCKSHHFVNLALRAPPITFVI